MADKLPFWSRHSPSWLGVLWTLLLLVSMLPALPLESLYKRVFRETPGDNFFIAYYVVLGLFVAYALARWLW